MLTRLFFTAMLACIIFPSERTEAQLAVTEVMSSASTNLGPNSVSQNSDYWELTNFGTNTIDLTGYKFDDSSSDLAIADPTPFNGLKIGAGESILFVESNFTTNEVAFREWWGTNLPASVRLVFYTGNGLSSGGDGIRLWGPEAQQSSDVIDSVDFGEAMRGSSFTYDPVTGEFGVVSTNGVNGTVKAATTDDVGSPGRTTGPTALTISSQPVDTVVNPGDSATFSVAVRGRPRGRFQWYYQNAPIPGATHSTLSLSNVQSAVAGAYYVIVDNGVTTNRSATAQLVLASEATLPHFTEAPADLSLYVGQSLFLTAAATGVPQPAFLWQRNGVDLPGTQGAQLSLSNVSEQDSGRYSVIARNSVGAVTNSFEVIVTPRPQLAITEVMSSASTNAPGSGDWWELTNFGNFPVNLRGLRFDDNSEMLSSAFVFTNSFTIAPNESIVFVESITPEEFRAWWGPEFLSPNLQILTFRGNGLSSTGDAVNLWNLAAAEEEDKLASAVFSTATSGTTFGYDPDTAQFGGLSAAGVNGAFESARGGDIGSPGYIRNSQRVILPRIREITVAGGTLRLVLSTQPGAKYAIQSKQQLDSGSWATEKEVTASETVTNFEQPVAAAAAQRFFRIMAE